MNKKIGIVANCHSKESIKVAEELINFLSERSFNVLIEKELGSKIDKEENNFSELENSDLIVTVGGDGTILRTLQKLEKQKPIIGINTGEVGFLTKLTKENYKKRLKKLIKEFEVEERSRLSTSIEKKEKKESLPPAMNEVVIKASEPAKLLKLKINLEGNEIERFRADGLVVATPTGSTAYSMSAGGPIVDPKVEAYLLVPLAPYKLSARPFVVPSESEIKVELLRKGKKADIVVDGQMNKKITKEDVVKFNEAEEPALFIKAKGADFYSKVREKLV